MYYEYFGLRDAPFQFLPSNTLFLSAAHLEGLAALEWAFDEPSGLTLLVGEVGTGKTMLIHSLVARSRDDRVRIAQISDPTMSFEEMLGLILQQLRIHPAGRGKFASLQALKTFVSDPASTDRVILIFDEAQGLSDETLEELRLLSNSRPPQRQALQIILVGQPELIHRLNSPKLRALNQRIGARALLRPLVRAEVHDYVNCLLHAHGANRQLFSRNALDQLASLSGGLPRKINNLCHNALFQAYVERSPMVEPRHVQAAGAELENLLDASSDQEGHWFKVGPRAWHWMLGQGKPVMTACLAGLAVVAVVLAFGVETGRHARLARHSGVDTSRAQDASESSNPGLASLDQSHEVAGDDATTVASMPSSQPASHDGPPTQAPVAADGSPTQAPATGDARTQVPAAHAPQPIAPTVRPEAARGTLIAGRTSAPPEMAKTLPSTNSPSAASAVAPPASSTSLTHTQERRLRYEIKRAKSSFEASRYSNAIYHSKRALTLDPGNNEMRDLLQRAQAPRSRPDKSASIHEEPAEPVSSADAGQTTTETSPTTSSLSGTSFAGVVRSEISAGDAYMRAGNYDLALRKFLTASVLDPGNENLTDRIKRAQAAKETMETLNNNSAAGAAPGDPDATP